MPRYTAHPAPERRDRRTTPLHHARAFATQFAREEDGVLIIFGVYIFILILMIGGIGIDLMRFERDRTKLQYTLDRAVLAAADLDQTLDPSTVVSDYFDKSGMTSYLSGVTVDEGLGYRTVSATATSTVKTQFMHMTGVTSLEAPAAGTAEERIDGVEISLVLDVSGSMNYNSRLTNLKNAAKDFVNEMVANSQNGKLSISIIPYATQVSAPENVFSQINVTRDQTYSNCINFQSSDFDTAALDPTAVYQGSMHFDPWYYFDGRAYTPDRTVILPVCSDDAGRQMMLLQSDAATLDNFISNLSAAGNTSIDIGMKWGTALLDPSTQPIVDALIADGTINSVFSGRPTAYTSGDTLKVIVLMTDGQNTAQYFINNDFRSGNSNVWWNEQEGEYSIYVGLDDSDEDHDGNTSEPLFYWPKDRSWHDHAYGEGTYDQVQTDRVCQSYKKNGSCKRYQTVKTTVTVNEPGSAALVTYGDLWAKTSLAWNTYYNYAPWMGSSAAWNDWYYNVFDYVSSYTKDARTKSICDAAKAQQIIVFTIGFEAPSGGTAVLQDCASSPAHFFDVQGLEISAAFTSIASSIRKLRLTQ